MVLNLFQKDIFCIQIKSNIWFRNCLKKRCLLDLNKIKYMILKLFQKIFKKNVIV